VAFILGSETAFDMRHIGLNILIAAATARDQATVDLVGANLDFTVGSTVFTTSGHTMPADTMVTVHAASLATAATLTEADFMFNQPDFVQAGQVSFFTGWDYA
jgi:hypothetical protein